MSTEVMKFRWLFSSSQLFSVRKLNSKRNETKPNYPSKPYIYILNNYIKKLFSFFSVKNLALGQNATMSSIADNSKPEFAVDGIYNRKEGCIKMASSGHARHNWLRIDFGGWKHVGFVEIHNRNYNGNLDVMRRISNSFVYVYGESPTENRQLCAEIVDGGFKVFNLPCIKTLYGKGLELYQTDLGYDRWLHVCEIIVLGY